MLLQILGTSTFLADSIHVLPLDAPPIAAYLRQIQKRASRVFFETDLDGAQGLPALALLRDGVRLGSLLDPEVFECTARMWHEFNLPLALETLKPWEAGMVLGVALGAKTGWSVIGAVLAHQAPALRASLSSSSV